MLTITILSILAIILAAILVLTVVAGGAGTFIMFVDILIFAIIVYRIVKRILSRR